ncbi:hypothetical protein GW17_00010595, partial [Ensete ventricosum]
FLTRIGIGEVRNDPWEYRRCYLTDVTLSKKLKASHFTLENIELLSSPSDRPLINPWEVSEDPHKPEPTERVLEVLLDKCQPDRVIKIGSMLLEKDQV